MSDPVKERYTITKLHATHQRQSFHCGITSLDNYIHKQARQDEQRNIAVTYVLTESKSNKVIGYYTLSASTLQLNDLPEAVTKKLPHYPLLPTTLIGRFAIDVDYQGQKIGERLLMNALEQAHQVSLQIASFAVIVDAINDKAIQFYKKYGFIPLTSCENKLYLPMKTLHSLF